MTDSIFGLSEKALALSEERAVILSSNMVNSATPHYQAKDINFRELLKNADSAQASNLATTEPGHLQPSNGGHHSPTMYRVPMKTSLDGNTVDEDIERKNFLQNALNYQVNLTFMKNTTDRLMKAIKGE